MIISQQVFTDNMTGGFNELVDEARVDGSLYGDKKLYYATNALRSNAWGNDAEATFDRYGDFCHTRIRSLWHFRNRLCSDCTCILDGRQYRIV